MAQFTVRNVEDDIKARLKRRAARHGVSMEAEVRQILRNASASDYRWSTIIMNIVQSQPFQMRMMPAVAGAKVADNHTRGTTATSSSTRRSQ